jgi:hypothetical protein
MMDSSAKKRNPTDVLQNGENFAKEGVMQNGEFMQNTCQARFQSKT